MAMRLWFTTAILSLAATLHGAEERTLGLVWLDAHGLFPDFARVREEAEPIFRDLGVSVRWEVETDPRPAVGGEVRVQVVLMPSEPSGWGISANAMGAVLLPDRGRQDSVYLFYPSILRNAGLGHRAGAMLRPPERRDLSRAIARVVVHEVVHAIAPNLSHADEGVMHESLLAGALLKRDIEIDRRTREEFLRGLTEFPPLEKINALEFLARVITQIPEPRRHMLFYYGHYANVVRGRRQSARAAEPSDYSPNDTVELEPTESPPSKQALRRRWADLIRRVFELDPLLCPCGATLRVVAFILETELRVIRIILEHLKNRPTAAELLPLPLRCNPLDVTIPRSPRYFSASIS